METFDKTQIKACVVFINPITRMNKMTTWKGEYKRLFVKFTDDFIEAHRDFWEDDGEILLKDVNSQTIEKAYIEEIRMDCPQVIGWLMVTVLI